MANNGFQSLGYALGGGARAGAQDAFMQGQVAQANVQHLSAATQEAMENAKLNQMKVKQAQDEQDQKQNLADALLKIIPGATPEQANAFATVIRSGAANFEGMATGRGQLQTQGFRQTLADPNAAPDVRLGAAEGIQGKPLSPFVKVDSESINAFSPTDDSDAPVTHETPLGDAVVNEHLSNANLHNAQAKKATAEANNPGGPKLPVGYEADPENPGHIRPIVGGPHDPNAPQASGSRESIFRQRVLNGAKLALGDIQNIVELPVGASTGILGVGAAPGHSILASAKGALTNEVAPQEVQDYNSIITGIERNLASIETSGMVPSQTFTNSFGSLALRPGDTEFTKLGKLAQMRQIIENGLDPVLHDSRVPAEQKQYVQDLVKQIQTVVPFTRHDVTMLQRAQDQNPAFTLGDLMKQKGLGGSTGNAQPTGQTPTTNSKGWVLHVDAQGNKAYVSPDGKQYEEVP